MKFILMSNDSPLIILGPDLREAPTLNLLYGE